MVHYFVVSQSQDATFLTFLIFKRFNSYGSLIHKRALFTMFGTNQFQPYIVLSFIQRLSTMQYNWFYISGFPTSDDFYFFYDIIIIGVKPALTEIHNLYFSKPKTLKHRVDMTKTSIFNLHFDQKLLCLFQDKCKTVYLNIINFFTNIN